MKRYVLYMAILFIASLGIISCKKSNNETSNETTTTVNKDLFASHILTSAESAAMIELYNQKIGPLIQQQFTGRNAEYVSPNRVIYSIAALKEYLAYLQEKGYSEVRVRFAAVEGTETNGGLAGMPYHTVIFQGVPFAHGNGNGNGNGNGRVTDDDPEDPGDFDHGDLAPPPSCNPCPSNCSLSHTHCK